jgi:hypothetical protein
MKSAYVCGPLTEIPRNRREQVKAFYVTIGDLLEQMTGIRAFVPHEHYDPVKNANFTPTEVDAAERVQVCENTSLLIVIAIVPSWGGGIEVEMAFRSGVPVLLLCPRKKLKEKRISRLLQGNPGVVDIISYASAANALAQLRDKLREMNFAKAVA